MFLHELSCPQREAFLTLAARLTATDAHLHDAELAMLTLMREEMALPLDWRPSLEPTSTLLESFDTPRTRAVALLELLRLIRADGQVSPEERAFLRTVALAFGASAERIRTLARWLDQHHALLQEGDRLLSEES